MTDVPSNLIPSRLTSMPIYGGTDTDGSIYYVLSGVSYQAQLSTLLAELAGGTVTSVNASGGNDAWLSLTINMPTRATTATITKPDFQRRLNEPRCLTLFVVVLLVLVDLAIGRTH